MMHAVRTSRDGPYPGELRNASYRPSIADNNTYEHWEDEGSQDAATRANGIWKKMLAEDESPPIDEAVDDELQDWIARQKASFADRNV